MGEIKITKVDITELEVDAIVNATNKAMCGGGGVDGAIHRAAGPQLLEECRLSGGCETGQSKITKGHNLPAKHVIHTVGPVWYGGHKNEEALLASCYSTALALAVKNSVKTIAFPAISCGAYKFPIDKACKIAVNEICSFLESTNDIDQVLLVCFDKQVERQYSNLLDN